MKHLIIILLLSCSLLSGIDFKLKNNLNINGRLFERSSTQVYHFASDYKPNLFITFFENESFSLDSEQSLDLLFHHEETDTSGEGEMAIELYRSWLRYSATQYEVRLGRQKLNFGQARILRPLKWFDTIDPTDPIQASEGVDALLFRYYFLNNANLWIWAIDPDEDIYAPLQIQQSTGYEFGGRMQYPFKYCEAAFSYHRRDLQNNVESPFKFAYEDRFGFDCRWDFQAGLWIETLYSALANEDSTMYSHLFTVGTDYTVNLGNGVYLLAEHMFYENMTADFPLLFQDASATALMASYPIGLFDSVSTILNYDWITENFFYYLSYSRSYDYISFYLNFFWNPDFAEYPLPTYNQDGKSLQLLMEINF